MGLMSLTTITTRLLAAAALVTTTALLGLLGPVPMASGQTTPTPAGAASCTASLLTSFTPCFSYLTNSSNGSSTSAPTRECCRSLAALVNASTGCACLVLTGAVPLMPGVPVNRSVAVSLPKACDSMSVPLQCRDTSPAAQTPAAAGPVADTPSTPAASTTPEAPAAPTTGVGPTATAPVSQGQTRPMVLPSSARRTTSAHVAAAPALVLLLAVAGALY